jgi:tetratricopeptide (TPR) repeat protein
MIVLVFPRSHKFGRHTRGILLFLLATLLPGAARSGPDPEEVSRAVRHAQDLFTAGEYNAGILLLEGMREMSGDAAPVLAALGDGYRTMRLWSESAGFYRRAVQRDSLYAPGWSGWGRVLFENQQPDSARVMLERALRLDPRDSKALGLVGELALERQDFPVALGSFESVLKIEGETLEALSDLAVVHERMRDWDGARSLLERAVRLYPDRPQPYYNLAVLESQAGRFHESVLAANRALELEPEDPSVLRFLGVLYFENQVCDEAVRYFQRVLALSPSDVEVRVGLASCLHALGRSDEAVRQLEDAMNDSPRDYDLLLLAANIRLEQNHLDEALDAARHAAALDSLRPDAFYLAGLALRRLGRADEAMAAFDRVERLRRNGARPGDDSPNGAAADSAAADSAAAVPATRSAIAR